MFLRKNNIPLLVVLYSLLLSGCNAVSRKASYEEIIYPESIELIDPDNTVDVERNVKSADETFDYYFRYWNYQEGATLTIKAIVKPDNSFYQNVIFTKDAQNTDFSITTNETDASLDNGCARFTLNVMPNPILSCRFLVNSTNPGVQINVKALVVFTTFDNSSK